MGHLSENQADEFMAYYYKSIDQPLKPCRPITYIYCCMSFLIAYNGLHKISTGIESENLPNYSKLIKW